LQVLFLLFVLLANIYTFCRFYYYKSLRLSLVTQFDPSRLTLILLSSGQRAQQDTIE
jgi:hypothetical protein